MELDSEYFMSHKISIRNFTGFFFVIIQIVINWVDPQAPVAQWIARWTSNPKVVGSSPTWGSIFMFYHLPQFLQLHLLLLIPTMQLSTIDEPVLFQLNIFFFLVKPVNMQMI